LRIATFLIFCTLVLGIRSAVHANQYANPAPSSQQKALGDNELRSTSDRLVTALVKGDQNQFVKMVSRQGVTVRERTYSYAPKYIWLEKRKSFKPGDLSGRQFKSVFRRFHFYSSHSLESSGSGNIHRSMHAKDHWRRPIGPAIEGKLASSSFWYVQFVQENGEFKISDLVYAVH
jgi:hypothetical protein